MVLQLISMGKRLLRLVIIAVGAYIVFGFLLTPVFVSGQSMEPTYDDHSFTFINRLSPLVSSPDRGEIVAVKIAGKKLMFLKRIIGLPGETIAIEDGQVIINDEPLNEPYLIDPEPWEYDPIRLEKNEYFIIGDNRRQPMEQHVFGRVSLDRIVGSPIW